MTLVAVALLGSFISSTLGNAEALLISQEEHWKYNVQKWAWDSEIRRTYGIITPKIVIQNETSAKLEGYIADSNGTRLEMYDGEQYVHVRFLSNNSIASDWQLAGRIHDGYFSIDIPDKYKSADVVRIYIGNHRYTVDNGTPTTPQTEVAINAAMLYFNTNSTLDQMPETEITELTEPEPMTVDSSGSSLIDWILSSNGMLPVRSSDSGE